MESPDKRCPDCAVPPGRAHQDGCDVARCLQTGRQRLTCDAVHDCGEDTQPEHGQWPDMYHLVPLAFAHGVALGQGIS